MRNSGFSLNMATCVLRITDRQHQKSLCGHESLLKNADSQKQTSSNWPVFGYAFASRNYSIRRMICYLKAWSDGCSGGSLKTQSSSDQLGTSVVFIEWRDWNPVAHFSWKGRKEMRKAHFESGSTLLIFFNFHPHKTLVKVKKSYALTRCAWSYVEKFEDK